MNTMSTRPAQHYNGPTNQAQENEHGMHGDLFLTNYTSRPTVPN